MKMTHTSVILASNHLQCMTIYVAIWQFKPSVAAEDHVAIIISIPGLYEQFLSIVFLFSSRVFGT